MPIGAIRSLTTEVGAGRSVPGATAALGTPSLPKGAPGSVFALYVPNRQTLSCLSRTRALVFTFCLLHPNEGKPTVLGLGLAAGPLDLVFSGRLTFGWGSLVQISKLRGLLRFSFQPFPGALLVASAFSTP